MNDIFKQRLVGALILIALGVLFWPIIFVEPDAPAVADQSRFLAPPEVDTTPLAPPDASELRSSPQFGARQEALLDNLYRTLFLRMKTDGLLPFDKRRPEP